MCSLFRAWQMLLCVLARELNTADRVQRQVGSSSVTQLPENFRFSSTGPRHVSPSVQSRVHQEARMSDWTVLGADHRWLPVFCPSCRPADFTAAVVEALICCLLLLLLLLLDDLLALQWNYLVQQLAEFLAALKDTIVCVGNKLLHRSGDFFYQAFCYFDHLWV